MSALMRRACLLAVAVAAVPGCNCTDRRIDATLTGTLEIAGQSSPVTFTGGVGDSSAGGSYELVERVVSDASRSTEAHTIVWTMRESSGGAPAAFLSFALRVPVAPGDRVSVSLGSAGGGWGVLTGEPRPTPLTANVYFERGDFIPNIARGTLTVVRSAPLALDLDVTFFVPSGETARIQGRLSFATSEMDVACFS